jgi:uncharacterized protein (TIGR02646 family)
MITLTKYDADDDTHGKSIKWLNDRRTAYRDARLNGDPVKHFLDSYRDARVKSALLDETHDKCAYCESQYRAVSFGDVEHILPRVNDLERVLDYENLTLACSVCNNVKSDYEDPAMSLLDSYDDTPERRLTALGSTILPRPGTDADKRALNTIAVFRLNERTPLQERRQKIVDEAARLADDYLSAPSNAIKNMARRQIADMCCPNAEYSLVARAVFATLLTPDELATTGVV